MIQGRKLHNTLEQRILKIHLNYGQVNQIELNITLEVVVNQHIPLSINLQ